MYSPNAKGFAYKCGLTPGTKLRLTRALEVTRADGTAVHTHMPRLTWEVLAPGYDIVSQHWNDTVVWLRDPNGRNHTWDDDNSIVEYFDVV